LDQAGYEEVKGRTEWIETIEDWSNYRTVGMSPIPDGTKAPGTLDTRKLEWEIGQSKRLRQMIWFSQSMEVSLFTANNDQMKLTAHLRGKHLSEL
jgi:hypothetical protein